MKITLVQTTLFWEEREKNLEHFGRILNECGETDLVVLPEMFTTGFTMNPELMAEENGKDTLAWMKELALKKSCVITGSVSVKENGRFFNRLFWVEPNGLVKKYDKRHLFRMGKEDEHYTAGSDRITAKIDSWNICPLVCYDLRFPVWSRNRFNKVNHTWDYDVLIYVANWPAARNYPWKQLLIARAIENQCYVVGVNRIGKDGKGITHSGDSMVINPRGEIISNTMPNQESLETVELDRNSLIEFRKIFPVGLDSDDFLLAL